LDEDFLRVYPAMLHTSGAGVPSPNMVALVEPIGGCLCHDVDCMTRWLSEPGQKTMAVQNCHSAGSWRTAHRLMLQHMEKSNHSEVAPLLVSKHMEDISEATGIPIAVISVISAVDVVLAVGACWLIFVAWQSASSGPAARFGINTLPQLAVLLAFLALSVAVPFLQQRAGTTRYSTISATFMIYFGKCVVSFAMFLCRADIKAGFSTQLAPGCNRFGNLPALILPIIPGGLLAGYDVLSYQSLVHLDPATYQILLHMRTIFVCFLWQLMFQRKLSATQWMAVLLFISASITKGLDRAQVSDAELHAGVYILIIQISMSAFASVFSEVLLKEMPMPTDLINTWTYLWGLVWLAIAMLYQKGPGAIYSDLLSPTAWSKLQADPWMIASICALTGFGIVTAYLLKELSNIIMELSRGFIVIASMVLELLILGSSVINVESMFGVSLAVLGVCVYSTDPLQSHSKQVEEPSTQSAPEVAIDSK